MAAHINNWECVSSLSMYIYNCKFIHTFFQLDMIMTNPEYNLFTTVLKRVVSWAEHQLLRSSKQVALLLSVWCIWSCICSYLMFPCAKAHPAVYTIYTTVSMMYLSDLECRFKKKNELNITKQFERFLLFIILELILFILLYNASDRLSEWICLTCFLSWKPRNKLGTSSV